ncbi:hypothetical protein Zmor_005780 [Zophobas morio]|uniref:Uncharacterized protein n=1 Tax=Zophobas morio TaxID=2755281 RepID=A0AA38IQD0_9CUCU|nr:hypothetical protein Zmor_005780 [Zophobas morio]
MKTGKQPQTKRPKEERLAKDHVQYLKQWILVLVKLRTSQIKTLVETGDVHFTSGDENESIKPTNIQDGAEEILIVEQGGSQCSVVMIYQQPQKKTTGVLHSK